MNSSPILAAALALAAPASAQDVVGTMTATIGGEERALVVVQGGPGGTSRFDRDEGLVDVALAAHPDRRPAEGDAIVELRFSVAGMGPTADATETAVSYYPTGEDVPMTSAGGTAEVSLTAFGIENETLTVSGNFSSQLSRADDPTATTAIEGDFQATIRPPE